MAEFNHIVTSLNAGEFSPRLLSRVDFEKYSKAVEVMENYLPLVHGGAKRRAGTRFAAEVKDSTKKCRLIPFEFNTEQAYVLEFGNKYIRFYRNNGQILVVNTDAVITNGTFGSDITGWANKSTGSGSISWNSVNQSMNLNGTGLTNNGAAEQSVTIGAGFQSAVHVLKFEIKSSDTKVINGTFDEDIHGWRNLSGDATAKVERDKETSSLKLVGTASVAAIAEQEIFIDDAHKGKAHAFKFDVKQTAGAPLLKIGTTPGASDITSTNLTTLADNQNVVFTPNVNKIYVRIQGDSVNVLRMDNMSFVVGVKLRIGTTTGGTQIANDVLFSHGFHTYAFTPGASPIFIGFYAESGAELDNVSLIANAPLEIDSPYLEADLPQLQVAQSADVMWITHRGYMPRKLIRTQAHSAWSLTKYFPAKSPFGKVGDFPRAVSFAEQRIWFGGTDNDPQTFWGSRISDFDDLNIGTDASDAFKYRIASGQVNTIVWISPMDKGMAIGTAGSEFTAEGGKNENISPTNILLRRRTQHGSREVLQPLPVGGVTLFIQKAGHKLRELVYNFESDNFKSPDLTVLADHVSRAFTIDALSYKQEPDSIVWAVRSDGVLLALSYDRGQDVIGWSRHIIGGSFSGGTAVVESVCTIPHQNKDRDQTWLIVKRTIGGATKRYVEFIGEFDGSFYDDLLLDCAITGSFGGAQTTITGLSHLNGEVAYVVGDGAAYGTFTVVSNQITGLAPGVLKVEVGYEYKPRIRSLRPELSSNTVQALRKQRPKIFVRVQKTLGLKINGQQLPYRAPSDPMDSVEPLFSGDLEVVNLGWDRDGVVEITQEVPQPSEVSAIIGRIMTED